MPGAFGAKQTSGTAIWGMFGATISSSRSRSLFGEWGYPVCRYDTWPGTVRRMRLMMLNDRALENLELAEPCVCRSPSVRLTPIIHERFCCNRRSAVAKKPSAGGLALGPSAYCMSTLRFSRLRVQDTARSPLAGVHKRGAHYSSRRGPRDAAQRFRDEPSGIMRAKILNVSTSVHPCRLLPLPVQPPCQISVVLGRDPILVRVILIQVRLKERERCR